MAEVDSIGNNFYFAGIQNTTNNGVNKNQKKQEIDKTKKSKFANLLSKKEDTDLSIGGRHDPCIVPRAVPCVEAAAAIAIYDAWLARRGDTERA